MGKERASEAEVRTLRELAAAPERVKATKTALYHLMAHDLNVADVCEALWRWIVDGRPVNRTSMHGKDLGQPAFEIWPDLAGEKFYCKFLVEGNPLLRQVMLVVSAHPDYPDGHTSGRQP